MSRDWTRRLGLLAISAWSFPMAHAKRSWSGVWGDFISFDVAAKSARLGLLLVALDGV